MTLKQNEPLVAIPNVLRNQTAPNTLGGRRAAPAPAARLTVPLRTIITVLVGLVVLASFLIGRI